MGHRPLTAVRSGVSWLVAMVLVCAAGIEGSARADDPGGSTGRLTAILARGNDQRVITERGAIRIIGFGQSKAKNGAIFFIHGDPEWFRLGAFTSSLRDQETQVLANHLEWLRRIAARGKYATYFVARTGVFGSDGETSDFRREDSYLSIGHAIDQVIKRDGIKAAAIAGHSGGAAVTLYHAIDLPNSRVPCYVLASGVYNLGAMAAFMRAKKVGDGEPAGHERTKLAALAFTPMPTDMALKLKYFEPLFHLAEMKPNPARQILAVSHRRDQTAPYFASEDVVARLKELGHRAQLINVDARPPAFHYTYEGAMREAASCLMQISAR